MNIWYIYHLFIVIIWPSIFSPEERLYNFQNKIKQLCETLKTCENDSLYSATMEQLEKSHSCFQSLLEEICRKDGLIQYEYKISDPSLGINICTSADKKIRIFSRDELHPGREHNFNVYIQYRIDNQSYLKKLPADNIPDVTYYKIQSIEENNKVFYLLSGETQYTSLHPTFILRAIITNENEVLPAFLYSQSMLQKQTYWLLISENIIHLFHHLFLMIALSSHKLYTIRKITLFTNRLYLTLSRISPIFRETLSIIDGIKKRCHLKELGYWLNK